MSRRRYRFRKLKPSHQKHPRPAYGLPGLDPALKAAAVAVLINILIRLMQLAFANPWDPMIQNALGFYTVWTLVRIISGSDTKSNS